MYLNSSFIVLLMYALSLRQRRCQYLHVPNCMAACQCHCHCPCQGTSDLHQSETEETQRVSLFIQHDLEGYSVWPTWYRSFNASLAIYERLVFVQQYIIRSSVWPTSVQLPYCVFFICIFAQIRQPRAPDHNNACWSYCILSLAPIVKVILCLTSTVRGKGPINSAILNYNIST